MNSRRRKIWPTAWMLSITQGMTSSPIRLTYNPPPMPTEKPTSIQR